MQFVPESPRYLVLCGKEEEAKRVLALMAWVNCKQPLLVRLVTHEKKEQLLEEGRNQGSDKMIRNAENSVTELENISSVEKETKYKDYGTVPNKEENEQMPDNNLVIMPSDYDLLTLSDKHTHKRMAKIKKIVKEKSTEYYHWFLLLFKDGWWRTTLIMWYLW